MTKGTSVLNIEGLRRHTVLFLLIAASIALAAWTVLAITRDTAHDADEFWQAFQIGGDEVEGYPTLQAMAEAADGVVIARLTSLGLSRTVQGDAEQDLVGYAGARVTVERTIAGSVPDVLTLELLIPTTATTLTEQGLDTFAARFANELPAESVLLFLRDKGGKEEGLYRVVNSLGLWISDPDGVRAPLYPADPGEVVYADETAGVSNFAELADRLSRSAPKP